MKYKNITERLLKFRAADKDGVKRVFELKQDQEMESDRIVSLGGLELMKESKQIIKKIKESDK